MHGEYISGTTIGYIAHPAAGTAGAFGANGTPMDAGSNIIIDSNISTLCRISQRLLVSSTGPGSVNRYATVADMFAAYTGTGADAPTGGTGIPWGRYTACRLGPVNLIQDYYYSTSGETVPRSVRFQVSYASTLSGGSLVLYYALTNAPDASSLSLGNYLAFGSNTVGGSPDRTTLSFTQRVPSGSDRGWPCRRNPSTTSSQVGVVPMWAWVGWKNVGSGGSTSIDSISVWESA